MSKIHTDYESAFEELKEIERALEQHTLPIEELSVKIERASELINYCKERLRTIESRMDDLFSETEEE